MLVTTTSTPMTLMTMDQFRTLSIFDSSLCYPTPSGGAEPCLSGHELFLLRFSTADLMAYTSTTPMISGKLPTNILAVAVSMVLTLVAFFAYCQIKTTYTSTTPMISVSAT